MGLSPARHTLRAPAADQLALALRALAGQTADVLQIQRGDGGVMFRVRPYTAEEGLLHVNATFENAPTGHFSGMRSQLVAKGTRTIANRTMGLNSEVTDHANVVNRAISGAADNGAGLIRITTAVAHGWATGDLIAVYGVGGTVEANGWWAITVIDATRFDLQGSAFANAYTAGGTATNRPMMTGLRIAVGPRVDRGGLTGTAQNADDVAGVTVINSGAGKATDAFYVAAGAPAGSGWVTGFNVDDDVDFAYYVGAHVFGVGLDLRNGSFNTAAVMLPNDTPVAAIRAGGGVQELFRLNALDRLAAAAALEGTDWTPVLTFSTPGNLNVVTSDVVGRTRVIGDLVFWSMRLTTSTFTHTTAAGTLRITGLPYTPAMVLAGYLQMSGWTKAGYSFCGLNLNSAPDRIDPIVGGSGVAMANLAPADMPSGGTVVVRAGGLFLK